MPIMGQVAVGQKITHGSNVAVAGSGFGPLLVIQNKEADTGAGTNNTLNITGLTTSKSNVLVVIAAVWDSGGANTTTVSDDASNSYTQVFGKVSASGNFNLTCFFTGASTALANQKITVHSSGGAGTDVMLAVMFEVAGASTAATADGHNGATSAGSTSIDTGAASQTNAGTLMFGAIGGNGSAPALSSLTFTDGTPTVALPSATSMYATTGANVMGLNVGYRIVPTTTPQHYTATCAPSAAWVAIVGGLDHV